MQISQNTRQLVWGVVLVCLTGLAMQGALSESAKADTLDRIRSASKVVFGYREDARPFSFKDDSGQPSGFTVALCGKVAEALKVELNLPDLAVEWKIVSLDDRTTAIQNGEIDVFCGADQETLERRKDVSFSIPVFAGGIGAVARANAPPALIDILEGRPDSGPIWRGSPARILNQRTFTVVSGTTAEKWLAERLKHFEIDAKTLPVETYQKAIDALTAGNADVFFGDRSIILETAEPAIASGDIIPLGRQFTYAPVALTIDRNNDGLRLLIDATLSRVFGESAFRDLYNKWIGPGDARALLFYEMNALPN